MPFNAGETSDRRDCAAAQMSLLPGRILAIQADVEMLLASRKHDLSRIVPAWRELSARYIPRLRIRRGVFVACWQSAQVGPAEDLDQSLEGGLNSHERHEIGSTVSAGISFRRGGLLNLAGRRQTAPPGKKNYAHASVICFYTSANCGRIHSERVCPRVWGTIDSERVF